MPPVSATQQPPCATRHQNRPRTGSAIRLRPGRTCVRFCFFVPHRGLLSYSRTSRLALHPARAKLSGRRRRACALASVRRPNRACSFPAHGFHEDSTSRGRKRRNQSDQIYQPKLAIEHRLRQLFPTTVAPAPESMRPDASHDPSVELVEELSDVGSFVVLAQPLKSGFNASTSCSVARGTRRFVRCRTSSLKRRIDLSRG